MSVVQTSEEWVNIKPSLVAGIVAAEPVAAAAVPVVKKEEKERLYKEHLTERGIVDWSRPLGSGSFGEVCETLFDSAVLPRPSEAPLTYKVSGLTEMVILEKLRVTKRAVELVGILLDTDDAFDGHHLEERIISPTSLGGDLSLFTERRRRRCTFILFFPRYQSRLSEMNMKGRKGRWITEVLDGLDAIHEARVAHLSLTSEKIYYDGTNYLFGDFDSGSRYDEDVTEDDFTTDELCLCDIITKTL